MPRTHVIQSWVGAAEYDEGDTYSGEQLGNRNQKSIGLHITRSGDQWYANPQAYADEKPKSKPKLSAFEKICVADRSYEKLCTLSDELDLQLDAKQIDWNDYIYARKQLDKKLERSWEAVKRLRGWTNEPEQYPSQGLDFTLDIEAPKQRQLDYSTIPSGSVFAELNDGNIFKKIYANLLTGYKALTKIAATSKQIIKEGLV